jgi:hypothetical protein
MTLAALGTTDQVSTHNTQCVNVYQIFYRVGQYKCPRPIGTRFGNELFNFEPGPLENACGIIIAQPLIVVP